MTHRGGGLPSPAGHERRNAAAPQIEVVLGAGHGDVQQPALLLDLGRRAGAEVGWHAAIDDVEQVDRFPFLTLGGMNGRENEIVVVEQRYAGLVAGRIRRIQRQFGQEAFARRISRRDLLELQQVRPPRFGIFVDTVEMRFVPQAGPLQIDRPFRIAEIAQRSRRSSSSRRRCAVASADPRAP